MGSLKHVIVEGPDGAGKTTLLNFLCDQLGLERRSRASSSTGGPVPSLADWYTTDRKTMHDDAPGIYDRHPLVSEPIYAQYARHTLPQAPFDGAVWVRRNKQDMAAIAYMVWCVPPLETVVANVEQSDQMPGVVAGIRDIHQAYQSAYGSWPGIQRVYDYTRHDKHAVVDRIREYVKGLTRGSTR